MLANRRRFYRGRKYGGKKTNQKPQNIIVRNVMQNGQTYKENRQSDTANGLRQLRLLERRDFIFLDFIVRGSILLSLLSSFWKASTRDSKRFAFSLIPYLQRVGKKMKGTASKRTILWLELLTLQRHCRIQVSEFFAQVLMFKLTGLKFWLMVTVQTIKRGLSAFKFFMVRQLAKVFGTKLSNI